MDSIVLFLYSRKGCCLCEALEEKLRNVPLMELTPSLKLYVKDIDDPDVPTEEKIRYDFEVPVLLLKAGEKLVNNIKLPRVSARIKEESLFAWLQKQLNKYF